MPSTVSLAVRWKVPGVVGNPVKEVKNLRDDNKIERFLTNDQMTRLMAEVRSSESGMLQHIVLFLLYTGARKREVLDATWADVDWERKSWRIPKTKSGKIRHIPLSTGALLRSYVQMGTNPRLLRLAAAAVSRLQTHQLSSLAQTQVGPEGNLLTTWQLEIPMRNQQELVPLQVKLQRDESPKKNPKESGETLWRVELAFDLSPLGPLQVQAQLLRGSLSSQLWAERPTTAELIDRELGHLRERLSAAGLEVGELACRQGVPPQGQRTTLEQRWVDETA